MPQHEPPGDRTPEGEQRPGPGARSRSEADVYRMKVRELRALLREAGVTGTSTMRKDELVRELVKTMHSDQRARSTAKVAIGKKSVVPKDDHAPSSRLPKPPRPAKRVPAVPAADVAVVRGLMDDREDVVELLLNQHEQIAGLFTELADARGAPRRGMFTQLMRLIAAHETIEQELVHPLARARLTDGDAVIAARIEEEDQAERDLGELYALGTEHDDFTTKLANLRDAVIEHAELEEEEEFDHIRDYVPAAELRRLVAAARAVTAEITMPGPDTPDHEPPQDLFARARDILHDR